MSMYHCEGLIKTVKVEKDGDDEKVMFTIEPSSTYLFERKKDDGAIERCLLFVEEAENPRITKIIQFDHVFVVPKIVDFHSLIIAKSNRMKVKVVSDLKGKSSSGVQITFI